MRPRRGARTMLLAITTAAGAVAVSSYALLSREANLALWRILEALNDDGRAAHREEGSGSGGGGGGAAADPTSPVVAATRSTGPRDADERGISIPSYHFVASADCSAYQRWQLFAQTHSARSVRQRGRYTWIISGCRETHDDGDAVMEGIMSAIDAHFPDEETSDDHSDSQLRPSVHFTPDFADMSRYGGPYADGRRERVYKRLSDGKVEEAEYDNEYKFNNKPNGLRHWAEHGAGIKESQGSQGNRSRLSTITSFDGSRNEAIVLIDPDFLFLAPFRVDGSVVRKGRPAAAKYGLGDEWVRELNRTEICGEGSPCTRTTSRDAIEHYNVGPPYIIHSGDILNFARQWSDFVPPTFDQYPQLYAEMYAYAMAAAHLELPHRLIAGLHTGCMTGWPNEGGGDGRKMKKLPTSLLVESAQSFTERPLRPESSAVSCFPPPLEPPPLLHFCQRYVFEVPATNRSRTRATGKGQLETGVHFFAKRRVPKDILDCDHAPLVAFQKPGETIGDSGDWATGADYTPRVMAWNTLAACAVSRAVNYARGQGCAMNATQVGGSLAARTNAILPEKGSNDVSLVSATTPEPKAIIAYAVSLTGCKEGGRGLRTAAAVLAASIRLQSFETPSSGSQYAHRMVAFVHPDAEACSSDLESLGYDVLRRETPVNITDIRGNFLRDRLPGSGCCGEKEFLKLYSYTLTDHPAVVHLDLDTLVLQPMDPLFDAMLEKEGSSLSAADSLPLHNRTAEMPAQIEAFLTRDYGIMTSAVGVQGGFLVVKPNLERFEEYRQIILEGNFTKENGWSGVGGRYYGDMRIQGLTAFHFDHIRSGTSVELDRCIYNNMADDPIDDDGTCLDGSETPCKDCRDYNHTSVVLAHFTWCQKPWQCEDWGDSKAKEARLCQELHHEWFRVLQSLDQPLTGPRRGNYKPDQFLGYCESEGVLEATSVEPFRIYRSNHFYNYYWKDLPDNAKIAAALLGFDNGSWDADESIPIYNTPWTNLNETQQAAISLLEMKSYFKGVDK